MELEKKHYKYVDYLRVFFCLAIFFFHLNILRGGYLAVCGFFVMNGYFLTKTLDKEDFNLGKHYLNRLKRIYLPLVIITLFAVCLQFIFSDIIWVSLKPETSSVLLGFNNFWQIKANQDYFARSAESPFTHFWYIAILLQFELVFPIIYIICKKLKVKRRLVANIGSLVTLITFIVMSYLCNINTVYYNTFSRVFSLLFGVSLYFTLNTNWFKHKKRSIVGNKAAFWLLMALEFSLMLFTDSSFKYYQYVMIICTIIGVFQLRGAVILESAKINKFDKVIKPISDASYEIYLYQYPIIFIFKYFNLNVNEYVNAGFIIIVTFILSFILHNVLDFKKKYNAKRIIILILIIAITALGGYNYVVTENHAAEMEELDSELKESEEEMLKAQEEYKKKLEEANKAWEETLKKLEDSEADFGSVIKGLPITAIGDSVMLGGSTAFSDVFDNIYTDAKKSRSGIPVPGILRELKKNNALGEVIVIHIGTNGGVRDYIFEDIMSIAGDREVLFLTVTNDSSVHVNSKLKRYCANYENAHLVDWEEYSSTHSEWFGSDKIHLTGNGRKAYAKYIYDNVYSVYLERFQKDKDNLLKAHEEQERIKTCFIGNDLLLSTYDTLFETFTESRYLVNDNYDIKSLLSEIETHTADDTLENNVCFMFDKKFKLTKNNWDKVIKAVGDRRIYIVTIDGKLKVNEYENVTIINLKDVIKENPNYLLSDKCHLSDVGISEISLLITDEIKK